MADHTTPEVKPSTASHQEDIAPAPAIDNNLIATTTNIEDDPHRAAIEDNVKQRLSAKTWAAVFFLGFTFQPALAFSILGVFPIISMIATAVQGSTVNSAWMSSGWTLGGSVAFAIAGRVSDVFGRRYVLLFGQVLLIISYILGATAQNLNQLIAAMAISGFGTGMAMVLYPGLSEILPNKYRNVGLAWTEANLIPMSVFGSLAGHALAQNVTWRWIFIIGAITGGISLVGTAIFYWPPNRPRDVAHIPRKTLLWEMDYLGFLLYAGGLSMLLSGLYQGSNTQNWRQAQVIVLIVLGAITFVACFVWDFMGPVKRPLFPAYMFKKWREFTFLIVCMFVTGVCYYAMASLIPQQLLHMFSSNPITLGLLQIAPGAGNVTGGVLMGGLIHKFKHVHLQLVIAVFMQTLFLGLLAIVTPNTTATCLAFQFLATVPFAWITVACYTTVSLHIPQRDLGVAHGSIGTFRFLGGAIGSTMLNIIIQSKSAEYLPGYVSDAVAPLGFPTSKVAALIPALAAGKGATIAGATPDIIAAGTEATKWAWAEAFRMAYLATIPFGVIATCVAFFVSDPSKYFTDHVAIHLESDKKAVGVKDVDVEDAEKHGL